ncbi:MAG: hypothetical protein ACOY3M_01835 [Patescibacteria group bacterium]
MNLLILLYPPHYADDYRNRAGDTYQKGAIRKEKGDKNAPY